jgi:hypothetical protein
LLSAPCSTLRFLLPPPLLLPPPPLLLPPLPLLLLLLLLLFFSRYSNSAFKAVEIAASNKTCQAHTVQWQAT